MGSPGSALVWPGPQALLSLSCISTRCVAEVTRKAFSRGRVFASGSRVCCVVGFLQHAECNTQAFAFSFNMYTLGLLDAEC